MHDGVPQVVRGTCRHTIKERYRRGRNERTNWRAAAMEQNGEERGRKGYSSAVEIVNSKPS